MPNNESCAARSLCALAFCAFTVPAVLLLPRVGWLWTGIASVATAGLLFLLLVLRRRCAVGTAELAAQSRTGRVALSAALLWNELMLGAAAGQLCAAYPTGRAFPLVGLLLLLLAAYAAGRGANVVLRTCGVVFFFLIILYSVLLAFALPQVRWLSAPRTVDWKRLPAALAPICVIYLAEGRQKPTKSLPWLLGGVGLAIAAAFVTGGSLSPWVAAREDFPFYIMSKSLRILGSVERFEPIVSCAVTVGGFALLGLLCVTNARMGKALGVEKKRLPFLNFFLGGASMWLSPRLSNAFLAGGTAIFWGLLPLVILSVGAVKKS